MRTCTICGRQVAVHNGQLAAHYASTPTDRFVQYGVLCRGSAAKVKHDA